MVPTLNPKHDFVTQPYRDCVILVSLIGFSLLLYAQVLPSYFLSDDFDFIAHYLNGKGIPYKDAGFLRPVSLLSYGGDYFLWKLNPTGFHLTNTLLHGLNAFLLYAILRRFLDLMKIEYALSLALVSAGLFVALPCHSEVVAWIGGRTDAVVTAYGLGATFCLVRLLTKRSLGILLGFFFLFCMSLLAKENAVILPVVWTILVGSYLIVSKQKPSAWHFHVLGGLFACIAAYLLVRWFLVGHVISGYDAMHLSWFNFTTIVHGFIYTLRAFVLPLSSVTKGTAYLLGGLGLAFVCIVLFFSRRSLYSAHGIFAGALVACFYVSLIPALPMPVSLFSLEGERHLYMPSIFLCSLLPLIVLALSRSRMVAVGVTCLLIVVEGYALQESNTRWVAAAQLSEEIAQEMTQYDPQTTVVLNIPDNFQGAYVFRNGLNSAATVFLGKQKHNYRILTRHTVSALDDLNEVNIKNNQFTLSLPHDQRFVKVHHDIMEGLSVKNDTLSIDISKVPPDVERIVFFQGKGMHQLLRVVNLRSWPMS